MGGQELVECLGRATVEVNPDLQVAILGGHVGYYLADPFRRG
jgi:hypothetical protein